MTDQSSTCTPSSSAELAVAEPKRKKSRKVMTLDEKRKIVQRFRDDPKIKVATVAREYGVNESTIRTIKKNERMIITACLSDNHRKVVKAAKDDKLDTLLYNWFKNQRAIGLEVNMFLLRVKAGEFSRMLHGEESTFKASNGWAWNFQKRHGLRNLRITGEKRDSDYDAASEYRKTLSKLIIDEKLSLDAIYNADESGLVFKKTFTHTLVLPTEKKADGKKVPKQRVTFLCCSNASGNDRLKLLIIGKSKNPRCFSKINRRSLPGIYTNSTKAWMTEMLFTEWFAEQFVPHVKAELKKKKLPPKAVLLVDNCSCHKSMTIDGITCMFLPPNTTALIQPMDQGPISALKRRYLTSFMINLMNRPSDKAIDDVIREWNVKDTINTLGTCWAELTTDTLRNAWKLLLVDYFEDRSESECEIIEPEETNDDEYDPQPELTDDMEAEIALWMEQNDELPTSHEMDDQELYDNLMLGERSDEDGTTSDDDIVAVSVSTSVSRESDGVNSERHTKLSNIQLVTQLTQTMEQLSLKSFTSDQDTVAINRIIHKLNRDIFSDKDTQKKVTDFFSHSVINE